MAVLYLLKLNYLLHKRKIILILQVDSKHGRFTSRNFDLLTIFLILMGDSEKLKIFNMKTNIKNLFSLSLTGDEYFDDKQEKFELVSCPVNKNTCDEIRQAVNTDYLASQQFHLDKNYQKSMDALQSAYKRTLLITEYSCTNCADFFRTTIKESMEEIKKEQQKLPFRILNFKHFQIIPFNLRTVFKRNVSLAK